MIKINLLYIIDSKQGRDTAPVRLRVRWDNNIISVSTGLSVDPSKWVSSTGRVKNNTTHGKKHISAASINRELTRLEEIATSITLSYEEKSESPYKNDLKDEILKAFGRKKEVFGGDKSSFFSAYDLFVKTQSVQNSWSDSTLKKFNSLRVHLFSFDSEMSINDIKESDLQRYVENKLKHNYKNPTVSRHIGLIRWFLRWANRQGLYSGNLHETFKPRLKGAEGDDREIVYLTWDELIYLFEFEFPAGKEYLDRVRDIFCLCCFTGLRYSDVYALKKSDIKDDSIHITTIKDKDSLKIELNKYSRHIIEKYIHANFPQNKALPVISNQKMNNYLKEIGEICEFNDPIKLVHFVGNKRYEQIVRKCEVLTTHCGRRTFVVNALRLGIPTEVIMKWTGHSDAKSMEPYVKIVDELKREEMSRFDSFCPHNVKKADKTS